jgi:predicted transcriptional regulator
MVRRQTHDILSLVTSRRIMAGRKPTVSDEEILQWIALAPDPVVTTSELSEEIEMTQQGVYSRLQDLEDAEFIRSKKVGSRARVWWITDRGKRAMNEPELES